jgi:hypothetical protein
MPNKTKLRANKSRRTFTAMNRSNYNARSSACRAVDYHVRKAMFDMEKSLSHHQMDLRLCEMYDASENSPEDYDRYVCMIKSARRYELKEAGLPWGQVNAIIDGWKPILDEDN